MVARKTSTATATDTTPEVPTAPAEGGEPQGIVETTDGEQHTGVIPESAAVPSTEGTTSDELADAAKVEPEVEDAPATVIPDETTLDSDTTAPSTTAPGDGPADTTDPRELASSAPFYPGPAALAAGTVNAVQKVGEVPDTTVAESDDDRIETYDAIGPQGETVTIRRNLETGESRVVTATE